MTYLESLKAASKGTISGLFSHETWSDIGIGLIAVFVTAIRVFVFVLYPITTPLIALVILRDESKRMAEEPEIRAKLRRGIHQNGPGV